MVPTEDYKNRLRGTFVLLRSQLHLRQVKKPSTGSFCPSSLPLRGHSRLPNHGDDSWEVTEGTSPLLRLINRLRTDTPIVCSGETPTLTDYRPDGVGSVSRDPSRGITAVTGKDRQ